MEELFREKLKFFLGGLISGGIFGGYGLFSVPVLGAHVGQLVWEYSIRFAGTIFIAFITGFLTVIIKDFYDIVIKHRAHTFFYFVNKRLTFKKKIKIKVKDDENRGNGKAA